MRFETEVWERYSAAQNGAMRLLRKNENDLLLNMETVLEQENIAGQVELGVYDIPVNQIIGVANNVNNQFYTSDFLPVPSINTEFAEKWCNLYKQYLNDREVGNPIQCYEYMGKFYVADGKKRVSIARVHGAVLIKAEITRILPAKSDEPRIRSYYEFVRTFEKAGVYQIAFTNPCDTDGFLAAMGYNPEHIWNDSDRWGFNFTWYPFEQALNLAFNGNLDITTADAVKVLMEKRPFAELKQLTSWALAELMQESWVELYRISDPDFNLNPAA